MLHFELSSVPSVSSMNSDHHQNSLLANKEFINLQKVKQPAYVKTVHQH
jgi:hypothetical protein